MFDKRGFLSSQGIDYMDIGDEINFHCPFCTDTRRRFFLNDGNDREHMNRGYCHNCQWAGGLAMLVSELLGISWAKAKEMVNEKDNRWYLTPKLQTEVKEKARIDWPEKFRPFELPFTDEAQRFWRYVLKRRGLPVDTVLDYKLGYCAFGYYRNRVVVPVYSEKTLVSWVARSIDPNIPKQKKALTPPGNEQSKYLLNLDKMKGKHEVVLVEGPFDVLKIPDISVASFGKRLSDEQAAKLKLAGIKHVIIAYDNDAQDDTYNTAKRISEMFKCSIVEMPEGEDPGSLDPTHMKMLISKAQPFKRRRIFA